MNSNQTPYKITIITLFPDLFPGPLAASLTGDALKKKRWTLEVISLRDYGLGRHKNVDQAPAGGGPGMVLRADVIAPALDEALAASKRPIYYLSPRGKALNQTKVKQLTDDDGMILLAGRFEGVDQRVLDVYNIEEISIGDFILTGGELPAMCLIDSVVRLLPGVVGDPESLKHESFENHLLEHPQFTKPRDFKDRQIPDVLLNGNHKLIEQWRQEQAEKLTKERRPDLYQKYLASKQEDDA